MSQPHTSNAKEQVMKVMFTVLNFGQTHLVTFTVLGHFRSSYKVKFGHLYSVMLTILKKTSKLHKTDIHRVNWETMIART